MVTRDQRKIVGRLEDESRYYFAGSTGEARPGWDLSQVGTVTFRTPYHRGRPGDGMTRQELKADKRMRANLPINVGEYEVRWIEPEDEYSTPFWEVWPIRAKSSSPKRMTDLVNESFDKNGQPRTAMAAAFARVLQEAQDREGN